MPSDEILTAAREWLAHDPDPDSRAELRSLIEADSDELAERFTGPLTFGTAGLRGILGAGESRMNRAVIRRTTAGLAAYLVAQVAETKQRGVVVGYDGRRQSDVFARDTAAVLSAAGIPCWLSESVCPTPLVAFAVKQLGAVAGVMVTASHNPPQYNGYKVYAKNGAQIFPPAERYIAEAIDGVPPADEIPTMPLDEAAAVGTLQIFGADLERQYLDGLKTLYPQTGGNRSIPVVYTALHGVGDRLFRPAMSEAGFTTVDSVAEQAEPDGRFPTVEFPNPEEPGAMDLVLALARKRKAALVLANDPDADRLAAAVLGPDGTYVQLSGNELGVLLGHHLLTRDATDDPDRLVVISLVSSPWLGVIARALGVAFEETLTGFKWIANRAMALEREAGKRFVFGYEEALGYTVGTLVRDKDGISAAVVLATLAAELADRGETLLDERERIVRRYGLFASKQRAIRFESASGAEQMRTIMTTLRDEVPTTIGGCPVEVVSDYQRRTRQARGGPPENMDVPQSNVLVFALKGGHRVVARPSGTEPKLKIYMDVREPLADDEPLSAAQGRAEERMAALEADMVRLAGVD
ncbi:MAG: phospho-sugar mutase [Deltaproteobacteria bacterium]|nr:phospho-sugar mutase [Deltaproteobacteria bacterium]